MYSVKKKFSFSAAHHLHGLPDDHPCSRQHGHNYEVEVTLSGRLNEVCFVRDYRDLDTFKKWLDDTVDHKDLNEVFKNNQTSAENLAYIFFAHLSMDFPELQSVAVSETPKPWAVYEASK